MRRLRGVFLNAGLAIVLIFVSFVPVFAAEQYKTYENSQLKYSVKYPGDFEVKPFGLATVFVLPVIDRKSGFQPVINIAVRFLPSPAAKLDDFFNEGKKTLTLGGSEVKILEEKKDKLSGVDAYRLIFISKQKKMDFKLLQVVSIYKARAYVITYTALQEQFDRNLNQAETIIKSLKFTD
ncbi:MAG: hypothetical protein V1919_03520 [Candidatus Omnitrophota bacterium]